MTAASAEPKRWYRVFGRSGTPPDLDGLADAIRPWAPGVRAGGAAGEDGWSHAVLVLDEGTALHLDRYVATEEGIRAELNAWAAHLETREDCPGRFALMERLIQSRQLVTLEEPSPAQRAACAALARRLAAETDGFYHLDGEGFHDAAGAVLVAEPEVV